MALMGISLCTGYAIKLPCMFVVGSLTVDDLVNFELGGLDVSEGELF